MKTNPLHSTGLQKQMELNSSTFKYTKLNKEIVNNTIEKVFGNYNPMNTGFVVYVGKLGQIALDIDFMRAWYNFPETYMESVNRGKYAAVIHLDKKYGLYKAYYNARKDNFDIKKGTVLLYTCFSVSPQTFEKLGFKVSLKTLNKVYNPIPLSDLNWELNIK